MISSASWMFPPMGAISLLGYHIHALAFLSPIHKDSLLMVFRMGKRQMQLSATSTYFTGAKWKHFHSQVISVGNSRIGCMRHAVVCLSSFAWLHSDSPIQVRGDPKRYPSDHLTKKFASEVKHVVQKSRSLRSLSFSNPVLLLFFSWMAIWIHPGPTCVVEVQYASCGSK